AGGGAVPGGRADPGAHQRDEDGRVDLGGDGGEGRRGADGPVAAGPRAVRLVDGPRRGGAGGEQPAPVRGGGRCFQGRGGVPRRATGRPDAADRPALGGDAGRAASAGRGERGGRR